MRQFARAFAALTVCVLCAGAINVSAATKGSDNMPQGGDELIAKSVRHEVLMEAGYKCGNPVCRNSLSLQLHHMMWVKEGGGNQPRNLLPLCGHCHDMHTAGHLG